jgi:hypothetical protein
MMDLYKVLGVSPSATAAEIKSAYRKLARKYHPDVSSSPDANARFARINEAYRILSNPKLRALYDSGALFRPLASPAAYAAEVAAYQRQFDRIVDEMIARERQETAARGHAVSVVVTLFVSSFYVAFAKPTILEELSLIGRAFLVALSLCGIWYLIKNLMLVLARYTYHVPRRLISIFREEPRPDKPISRGAGLVFLVCGYLVSLGLGLILSRLTSFYSEPSPGLALGALLYPPIAVLIISGFRRLCALLDRLG